MWGEAGSWVVWGFLREWDAFLRAIAVLAEGLCFRCCDPQIDSARPVGGKSSLGFWLLASSKDPECLHFSCQAHSAAAQQFLPEPMVFTVID